jgi:hypothetical protein
MVGFSPTQAGNLGGHPQNLLLEEQDTLRGGQYWFKSYVSWNGRAINIMDEIAGMKHNSSSNPIRENKL